MHSTYTLKPMAAANSSIYMVDSVTSTPATTDTTDTDVTEVQELVTPTNEVSLSPEWDSTRETTDSETSMFSSTSSFTSDPVEKSRSATGKSIESGGSREPSLTLEVSADSSSRFEIVPGTVDYSKKYKGIRKFVWLFCPTKTLQTEEKWEGPLEENCCYFRLAMIGFCIGLGNVWRFPYLVAQHGGGAFLLVYLVILFAMGFPLFFLEMYLGQFAGRNAVNVFSNLCPALVGVVLASTALLFIHSSIYNGVVSWSLLYAYFSIWSPIKWSQCHQSWNDDKFCFSLDEYQRCVKGLTDSRWFLKGTCYNNNTSIARFFRHLDSCVQNQQLDKECNVQLHFEFSSRDEMAAKMTNDTHFDPKFTQTYDKCQKTFQFLSEKHGIPESGPFKLQIDLAGEKKVSTLQALKSAEINITNLVQMYCDTPEISVSCSRKVVRAKESHSSEEFFNSIFNSPDASSYDPKGFYCRPIPVFFLFLVWVLIVFGVLGGVKLLARVFYVTISSGFVITVVLVTGGVVVDGLTGLRGISFYVGTEFCALADSRLWAAAISQIFFTLGLGMSVVVFLASLNRFQNDILLDSLIVLVVDSLFSFLVGFGVFGLLGFLAYQRNVEVSEVVSNQGPELIFVTVSSALSALPVANLWSFFFFLLLCIVAFDSLLPTVECLLMFLFVQFSPFSRRPIRIAAILVVCSIWFLTGLPFVSKYGLGFLNVVSESLPYLLFASLGEVVIVAYIYGWRCVSQDIGLMFGESRIDRRVRSAGWEFGQWVWKGHGKVFFLISWWFNAPLAIFVTIVLDLIMKVNEGDSKENLLEDILFWLIAMGIFPLCILIGFLGNYFRKNFRYLPVKEWFKPTEMWSPCKGKFWVGRFSRRKSVVSADSAVESACEN